MIGTFDCAALNGFGATKVRVEVDISRGLPSFILVGLAENSVKEARVRVQSAINNAGISFPRAKISVNLVPADLQKSGTSFDVAIGLAILQASGIIAAPKLKEIAAVGELSLTGEILPVRGMLAIAESIRDQGIKTLVVSRANAVEASLIEGIDVRVADSFGQLVRAVNTESIDQLPESKADLTVGYEQCVLDMQDVVGQEEARRAILIAAAGNHNLLFIGGPGSGKSMMAKRMTTILPSLAYEESLVLTKIYSIAGLTMSGKLIKTRPFRAPHHSITRAGLAGGGSKPIRPGELSLASFGVLFLDELLEFPRGVLEVLRQPLEDDCITICRANQSVNFPAKISFVGAMNPCPCGQLGQNKAICQCSPQSISRYQGRLSGPLMDRIDLHVNVPPLDLNLMLKKGSGESSLSMQSKVIAARKIQSSRFKKNFTNGKMSRSQIKEKAQITNEALSFLIKCGQRLGISARSFDRVIRVARTIADLEESAKIYEHHIGEALSYRQRINVS